MTTMTQNERISSRITPYIEEGYSAEEICHELDVPFVVALRWVTSYEKEALDEH
ncbi:hypothetical protein SAMN06296386_10919 [Lachnospiraceae bacterium]|nr:hypothetical protein SAMN06296386_10919 [Lachnospiraceae bacterium]